MSQSLNNNSNIDINLWLRTESFCLGSLPISPNSRLTLNNLKKIIPYVQTKDRKNFPNLTFSVWKHIACNKLIHTEELAWIYFWTFNMLLEKTVEQRLLQWDKPLHEATDAKMLESCKALLQVPVLPFVIFLFIQHLHKISLRTSLVTGSDEWPSKIKSPESESRLNITGYKGADESSYLTFVLNNLNDILELLVEPDLNADSQSEASKTLVLSIQAVDALDFIISGSANKASDMKTIRELAMMEPHKSGYMKSSSCFHMKHFQTWVRSNLTQNPFGFALCLSQGKNLCWPIQGESKSQWISRSRGQIFTNATFVPKDSVKGNKVIILSGVSKMTLARNSSTLCQSTVKISKCNDSFIYLLSPLRSVLIERCQRTTIVLGAVETSVDISKSEYVMIIAVARRFTAQSCKSCNVHIITPNTPLLFNANTNITFGPYHTHYPQLEEHMYAVGLAPLPNLWDRPQVLGSSGLDDDKIFEIQKPSDFFTFTIPFQMDGKTDEIPVGLPAKYQKAQNQRLQKVEEWHKVMGDANLTLDQKKMLHQTVQAKFQEWLQTTGQARLLQDLVVPTQKLESSPSLQSFDRLSID